MNICEYLEQHERKDLLRFLTCGSVDDGKSPLIGRLLHAAHRLYEDQLAAVRRDSAVYGTTGADSDPALVTDGLKAERGQGITTDVAYRYFSTDKRKFIIADTVEKIAEEMFLARQSERQGRLIDFDRAASMEEKKRDGYF